MSYKACALLVMLAAAASAGSIWPAGEAPLPMNLGGKRLPNWSGGALIVLDNEKGSSPTFTLLDRDGRVRKTVVFEIPGAAGASVESFTHGADGTVALTWSHYAGWVSADGREKRIIQTSPYLAKSIAVAADGTIWTLGFDNRVSDAKAFRHYDRSGKLLGSFVPQAEFRSRQALPSLDDVFGAVGNDVVWYSKDEGRYIRLSANGVVADVPVPPPAGRLNPGFALAGESDLFIRSRSGDLFSLDLALKAWTPVESNSERTPFLFGADGATLVGWYDAGHVNFFRYDK